MARKLKTYLVSQQETRVVRYRIRASSEAEAIHLLMNGDPTERRIEEHHSLTVPTGLDDSVGLSRDEYPELIEKYERLAGYNVKDYLPTITDIEEFDE